MFARPVFEAAYAVLPHLFSFDLSAWARGIANVLVPGGVFVLIEFHPVAFCFDEQRRVGVDIVAPSDMMDGRIGAVREALEAHRAGRLQAQAAGTTYVGERLRLKKAN